MCIGDQNNTFLSCVKDIRDTLIHVEEDLRELSGALEKLIKEDE